MDFQLVLASPQTKFNFISRLNLPKEGTSCVGWTLKRRALLLSLRRQMNHQFSQLEKHIQRYAENDSNEQKIYVWSEKWTSHEHAKREILLSHPIIFKSACGQDERSMRFCSPDFLRSVPSSSVSSICHCIDVYSTLHHNSSFFLCNSLFSCYRCYNVLTSHQVDFQYSIQHSSRVILRFFLVLMIIRLQGERTASMEAYTENAVRLEGRLKGVKKWRLEWHHLKMM